MTMVHIPRRKAATSDLGPRRRSTDGAKIAVATVVSACPTCERPLPVAEYVPFCSGCRRTFQVGETFYHHSAGPRCAGCMVR